MGAEATGTNSRVVEVIFDARLYMGCDWGECMGDTVGYRMDTTGAELGWLPVCTRHLAQGFDSGERILTLKEWDAADQTLRSTTILTS